MRCSFSRRLFTGLFAGLALVMLPPALQAADKDKEKGKERVRFLTYDEVELHGTFYVGEGRKSPTVLMLHELGGNSQQNGWDDLAKELKKEGYSVLTFDFRGHGKSTGVGKTFWFNRVNQQLKGFNPSSPRTEISYNDFPRNYYPYLVNDIVAAKRFLDEQNDAQLCNSSNLILIGARDGATLGMLWAASEFQHLRMGPNAFGRPIVPKGIAGEDITCAIWLSISPTIPANGSIPRVAGMTMPVTSWVSWPNAFVRTEYLRDKVPMYFITGPVGEQYSATLHGLAKRGKGKITQYDYLKVLKDAKTLAGRDLLGKKGLDTDEYISKYAQKVTEEGDKGWKDKDTKNKPPLSAVLLGKFIAGY